MAWTPTLPAEPRSDRWWHDREVYELQAAVADARLAAEQDKCMRQIRRRVEKVNESIVLALSRDEARRHLRRQGIPYESRSARPDEVEYFTRPGRILAVR